MKIFLLIFFSFLVKIVAAQKDNPFKALNKLMDLRSEEEGVIDSMLMIELNKLIAEGSIDDPYLKGILSQEKYEMVVYHFWWSKCPPCQNGMPELKELVKDFKNKGVFFLGLSEKDSIIPPNILINYPNFPNAHDFFGIYKVKHVPMDIVFNKEGKVIGVFFGYYERKQKKLRKLIQKELDNKKNQEQSSPDTIRYFGTNRNITGKPFVLENINFKTASYELLSSSFTALDKLADYLKNDSSKKVEISGHTDNIGNEKDNQTLSEQRAKAIADYLSSKGISSRAISFKGFGSSRPIANNNTEEGRLRNRRVEFILR